MTTLQPVTYLDHAATTPMRPEAISAMLPFLGDQFGNPSGAHAVARAARHAIEDARDIVAAALRCQPGEVVFTSGGTEADNLAVLGVQGTRKVSSAVEHHGVLHAIDHAGGATVPVDSNGLVELDALPVDADFVSVMLANNETGVVQPLAAVRERVPDAVLHTDAVAAMNWLDVGSLAEGCDLISISGHKLGGPKGVGVLVVRDGVALRPTSHGGGQERDRRSGTHNVPAIVALAAAVDACGRDRDATVARTTSMRDRLLTALVAIPDLRVTAPTATHTAGTVHVLVGGVESEALVIALDDLGVCASAGSACASGALEPSHVLAAMGVDRKWARGALRLSLGWSTTDRDVDAAVVAVPKAIETLRSRS